MDPVLPYCFFHRPPITDLSRSTLDLFSNPITRPLFIVCGNVPACVKAFRPVFVFFLPSVFRYPDFHFGRNRFPSNKNGELFLSWSSRCYCAWYANWFVINKIYVAILLGTVEERSDLRSISFVVQFFETIECGENASFLYPNEHFLSRYFLVRQNFKAKYRLRRLIL